ncbi:hypothetical protein EJ08DRAFT_599684 [Tothia fuscella]|uniref:Cupin type-2 domain-containing protein n=1 Tax=Tothia fuscella TaxID=1048955 RepID=A0A9P4NET5_9PEZI|nr:hypothetical protein EJ08DRAFT_599684 [Tothia fuscella]
MLSFLSAQTPRTKVAHLNTIHFDNDTSSIEFKSPTDRYLVINRWPPAPSKEQTVPGQAECALSPPPHWHYYQNETFHVISGTGRFMLEGECIDAIEGETVTIPAGAFHTFCNASMEEGLEVEFALEPGTRERDERFFRNLQTYRDDTRKAGMQPSLPQLLLFLRSADVLLALPGPKFIAQPLAIIMNFVGGVVIGKWLLGYFESYPEYCRPKTV